MVGVLLLLLALGTQARSFVSDPQDDNITTFEISEEVQSEFEKFDAQLYEWFRVENASMIIKMYMLLIMITIFVIIQWNICQRKKGRRISLGQYLYKVFC